MTIPPLAFDLDEVPGVALFQIVQSAPGTLRIRLRLTAHANVESAWDAAEGRLARLLRDHGLDDVRVERGTEPPEQSPGGKYRAIIPLRAGPA